MTGSRIIGKASTAIDGQHGRIHITVADPVITIKQNHDLVRLTWAEAAELLQDLAEAMDELAAANGLDQADNAD